MSEYRTDGQPYDTRKAVVSCVLSTTVALFPAAHLNSELHEAVIGTEAHDPKVTWNPYSWPDAAMHKLEDTVVNGINDAGEFMEWGVQSASEEIGGMIIDVVFKDQQLEQDPAVFKSPYYGYYLND